MFPTLCGVVALVVMLNTSDAALISSQLITDWGLLSIEQDTVILTLLSTISLSGTLVIVITGLTEKQKYNNYTNAIAENAINLFLHWMITL